MSADAAKARELAPRLEEAAQMGAWGDAFNMASEAAALLRRLADAPAPLSGAAVLAILEAHTPIEDWSANGLVIRCPAPCLFRAVSTAGPEESPSALHRAHRVHVAQELAALAARDRSGA